MGAMTRLQIESLAQRHEAEPEWFLSVCADISNGDSVDKAYAKLAENYDVSWGAFRNWVSVDEKREAQYQAALSARAELRREKAAARVAHLAAVEHKDKDVGVGDTLKAAAMVLDTGVKDGKGAAISITIVHESA